MKQEKRQNPEAGGLAKLLVCGKYPREGILYFRGFGFTTWTENETCLCFKYWFTPVHQRMK